MKHILCILLILSSLCFPIQAQVNKTFVIEGTVLDETDTPLPGATVYLRDKVSIGTSTNSEG
ncbi:MAG: hypothetical protein WCS06_10320, partial [Dysgonamonadaceae bacterium]